MRKLWVSLLGAVGLLAALAAPAFGQDEAKTEKVWKSDGKRWSWVTRTVKPVEESKLILVEVARAEVKEGDIPGMKTVGKHLETAYYRWVPRPEPVAEKGHACSMRVVTVLKHYEFRHFCRVDGAEKPCPGMSSAGECLAVMK